MRRKLSRYLILLAIILVCLLGEIYRLSRQISHVFHPRRSTLH